MLCSQPPPHRVFPKIRVIVLQVPVIRILVSWGFILGFPMYGNYQSPRSVCILS